MRHLHSRLHLVWLVALTTTGQSVADEASDFFERRIRPILVERCYDCHSEQAAEQQGGLLLDRKAAWLSGGESGAAVVPKQPDASLLIKAIRYDYEALQMPPEGRLPQDEIELLERWIAAGASGPVEDLGETVFSQLGNQEYLFRQAETHWAFQPVRKSEPPCVAHPGWNAHPIDRFIASALEDRGMSPSAAAQTRTLLRRLHYDLTGLPPTFDRATGLAESSWSSAELERRIDALLNSAEYGQHFARLWLDVVRYADTDSFYRPDTKTPHYFPFAFTYRDYVIAAFTDDKPYDQFIKEQLAADLMGFAPESPEIAALGFLAVGPHANRATTEALDDWIDLTTRGLMGISVACARCHDHKYEPVPTQDYYALRGVFAGLTRLDPLDDSQLPCISGYARTPDDEADFDRQRAAIEAEISAAAGKTNKGNNLPLPTKIRETKLAELLAFHPGGPAHAMIVTEKKSPPAAFVFLRGDAAARGEPVERRFLQVLDPELRSYPPDSSGRLQLAEQIVSPENPLTARVLVNRVWRYLIGSALVETDSDFGLQGAEPTHPELLDWLAADFVDHGCSIKHLVRTIVTSQTYQQSSIHRPQMAATDPQNAMLWRANRKHLSIESLRDSLLEVTGQLDHRLLGRPEPLWGAEATRRRAIYGFINRFNLDPTLRAFDFPAPMQTQPARGESIVAPQALFLLNSPLVIEQASAATRLPQFVDCDSDALRVDALFQIILQRTATEQEVMRAMRFVEVQRSMEQRVKPAKRSVGNAWELVAHSLLMSNEFQYVD